jgi:hypothetical protein
VGWSRASPLPPLAVLLLLLPDDVLRAFSGGGPACADAAWGGARGPFFLGASLRKRHQAALFLPFKDTVKPSSIGLVVLKRHAYTFTLVCARWLKGRGLPSLTSPPNPQIDTLTHQRWLNRALELSLDEHYNA